MTDGIAVEAPHLLPSDPAPGAVPRSRERTLGFLQALRAFAAISVVFTHVGKEMFHDGVQNATQAQLEMWQFGVDIFFIISGFIMVHISGHTSGGPAAAWTFAKRRLIRIVPLYWIYTTLYLLMALKAADMLNRHGLSIGYVAKSYLFMPAFRPGTDSVSPLFALGWTLNYEMLFYAIFTALLAFAVRRRVTCIAVIMLTLSVAGLFVPADQPVSWYWTRNIVLEFAYGGAIACAFRSGRIRLPARAGAVAILIGLAGWQLSGYGLAAVDPNVNLRGLTWGLCAALLFGGVALTPAFADALDRPGTDGLLGRLGDASYSIYLVHIFVVRIVAILFAKVIGTATSLLFPIIAVPAVLVVALLSYRFIEKSAIAFGRRYLGA